MRLPKKGSDCGTYNRQARTDSGADGTTNLRPELFPYFIPITNFGRKLVPCEACANICKATAYPAERIRGPANKIGDDSIDSLASRSIKNLSWNSANAQHIDELSCQIRANCANAGRFQIANELNVKAIERV